MTEKLPIWLGDGRRRAVAGLGVWDSQQRPIPLAEYDAAASVVGFAHWSSRGRCSHNLKLTGLTQNLGQLLRLL